MILAVDPGTESSAWVLYDSYARTVCDHGYALNQHLLLHIQGYAIPPEVVVFEQIESFGMAVGRETFETVFWTGVLYQAASASGSTAERLSRRAVKLHLCQSAKAKDTNIRQALLDRFGGSAAIGKKATPGPLYGLSAHEFAALAVAVTWADTHH